MRDGDFPIEGGDFPIERVDFPIEIIITTHSISESEVIKAIGAAGRSMLDAWFNRGVGTDGLGCAGFTVTVYVQMPKPGGH